MKTNEAQHVEKWREMLLLADNRAVQALEFDFGVLYILM